MDKFNSNLQKIIDPLYILQQLFLSSTNFDVYTYNFIAKRGGEEKGQVLAGM